MVCKFAYKYLPLSTLRINECRVCYFDYSSLCMLFVELVCVSPSEMLQTCHKTLYLFFCQCSLGQEWAGLG